MPSLRSGNALPLTLSVAAASLLSSAALLPAQAEILETPGRSRAPVSHGDVSSRVDQTLGSSNGRSKAPHAIQASEAEGISPGSTRSRAPVATP